MSQQSVKRAFVFFFFFLEIERENYINALFIHYKDRRDNLLFDSQTCDKHFVTGDESI